MNEAQARKLVEVYGGEAINSGGGCWIVKLIHENESMTLFSKHLIATWASRDAYEMEDTPVDFCEVETL